ncbi:MAG: hypothetical protein JWO82_3018, partial [Akkermansiaceae bacterium]|nr:hypothetical protein [Akkermansiaceae bacterium]
MNCSPLLGRCLFTFAAVVGFSMMRAGFHHPAEVPVPARPDPVAAALPTAIEPPNLAFLKLPEAKIPRARTVPDLVTELDGEEAAKAGVNLTSWRLGYAKSMRLMEAMLAEKRGRNGNDSAAAIAWLVRLLSAGGDRPSLSALAGEPVDLAEAAKVLDLLPGPDLALRFARDVLEQQCALEPRQAMAWLEEMKKRHLGTTEPYDARDFLPAIGAYVDLLERWEAEGVEDVFGSIAKLHLS